MNHPVPHERAEEIRHLFDAVADLPPDDRGPYLDRCCTDAFLRQEVNSLLAALEHGADDVREALEHVHLMAAATSTRPHDLIGQTLSRYHVQEWLGGGGMGVVYRARDSKLGRSVALKFLPPHLSLDVEAKTRLIHEAKTASALDHPCICTVYDIDETDDGRLFIAMAYYQGETLKERIARGPLPIEEALDYALQMTEGLKVAHEAGILHRDIKPSNVMLTAQDRVRLVDFGIAKVQDVRLTNAGTALGTAAYMSPEQARGDTVDQRTDLWSLGIVLYEMLVGERPFRGPYQQAVIYQVLNDEPAPMRRANESVPPDLEAIVRRCLQKAREYRYASASLLLADLHRVRRQRAGGSPAIAGHKRHSAEKRDVERARIFISYKRGAEPDDHVAGAVHDALRTNHDVFIDTQLPVGARWIEAIEFELSQSDFLIVLLSPHSIHSEMVLAEIETARRLAEISDGRPVLLPVRLAYSQPLSYPLNEYLDDLNWAYWGAEKDTPRIVEQLRRAIAGGDLSASSSAHARVLAAPDPRTFPEPLAAAHPLRETPEGTMDPHSVFYVDRPQDEVARRAIAQQGVTLTIKGPRQMGKSSLLARTMHAAAQLGKNVVFLDFQLFNQSALNDPDTFFKQFCLWISFKLKLNNRVEEYWEWPLGNSQCCTLYVEDCILGAIDRPLVVAMDEVERIFDTGFRSDFFGMLRSWHNDRATAPVWKRLDLALVTSTEPYQLIENLNQSPFNVGEIIEMKDFTPEQVEAVNEKHGGALSAAEIDQLMGLLSGHPYLTRKALYLVAGGQLSFPDLMAFATGDRGPFGDHLRYHLFRLHGQDDLIRGLREIIRGRPFEDEAVFWRLQGAGLVLREGRAIVPRCRLYAEYFREHFNA